jgi:expansin (peptidoglycan-binding protein)
MVGVTYRLARDPKPTGKLAFRVKEGSSRWWLGLLVIDHGNPLTSVEIRQNGRWRKLRHTDYNYWLAENPGPGPGPYTVRVTDTRGHRKVVRKIGLAPGKIQRTKVTMY